MSQSYKDIEIICVNNSSTDGTWAILSNLKSKNPSLQLFNESQPGASAARNKGLHEAKGEYVQFLDADDLLKDTKIEHQVNLIHKNHDANIGFVAGACVKRTLKNGEKIISEIDPDRFVSPFINKSGNTCSNLWNRESLLRISGWDQTIKSSQEADLMLRMILAGNSYLIDKEALTIIRERESGQISHRNPSEKWKQFIDIRLNYIQKLKEFDYKIYQTRKGILYDFIMVSVFTLAKYNKQEALKIYRDSIKDNWIPSGNYGFGGLKALLIRVLGLNVFLKLYSN